MKMKLDLSIAILRQPSKPIEALPIIRFAGIKPRVLRRSALGIPMGSNEPRIPVDPGLHSFTFGILGRTGQRFKVIDLAKQNMDGFTGSRHVAATPALSQVCPDPNSEMLLPEHAQDVKKDKERKDGQGDQYC